MYSTALIVFREVLEAALVIGLVAAASRGLPGRGTWIGTGTLMGLLGAVAVAMLAGLISDAGGGMGQEIFNAGILFSAVALLGWHQIWMTRHGAGLARQMKAMGQDVVKGSRPAWVLATVVGLAILREGSETVLFLYGIVLAQQEPLPALVGGGLAGLGAGAAIGLALYLGLVRIPTRYVFTVTGWLIALLAAGLAGQGAVFLVQADLLPALGQPLWDTSAWLSQQSPLGQLLQVLVGYFDRPAGVQALFYAFTLSAILGLSKFTQVYRPVYVRHYPAAAIEQGKTS